MGGGRRREGERRKRREGKDERGGGELREKGCKINYLSMKRTVPKEEGGKLDEKTK